MTVLLYKIENLQLSLLYSFLPCFLFLVFSEVKTRTQGPSWQALVSYYNKPPEFSLALRWLNHKPPTTTSCTTEAFFINIPTNTLILKTGNFNFFGLTTPYNSKAFHIPFPICDLSRTSSLLFNFNGFPPPPIIIKSVWCLLEELEDRDLCQWVILWTFDVGLPV